MSNQVIPEASGPLTIEQYCEMWQVCRSTVYGWINKGMLDSVKVGLACSRIWGYASPAKPPALQVVVDFFFVSGWLCEKKSGSTHPCSEWGHARCSSWFRRDRPRLCGIRMNYFPRGEDSPDS